MRSYFTLPEVAHRALYMQLRHLFGDEGELCTTETWHVLARVHPRSPNFVNADYIAIGPLGAHVIGSAQLPGGTSAPEVARLLAVTLSKGEHPRDARPYFYFGSDHTDFPDPPFTRLQHARFIRAFTRRVDAPLWRYCGWRPTDYMAMLHNPSPLRRQLSDWSFAAEQILTRTDEKSLAERLTSPTGASDVAAANLEHLKGLVPSHTRSIIRALRLLTKLPANYSVGADYRTTPTRWEIMILAMNFAGSMSFRTSEPIETFLPEFDGDWLRYAHTVTNRPKFSGKRLLKALALRLNEVLERTTPVPAQPVPALAKVPRDASTAAENDAILKMLADLDFDPRESAAIPSGPNPSASASLAAFLDELMDESLDSAPEVPHEPVSRVATPTDLPAGDEPTLISEFLEALIDESADGSEQ